LDVLGWLAGIAGWGDFCESPRESYEPPLPHADSKISGWHLVGFADWCHDVIHERFLEKHGELIIASEINWLGAN